MNDEERCETYETNAVGKGYIGGEGMQHIDDRCEPLDQFRSPSLLNSSNSRACSWNISRIESGLSQLSTLLASGWLRRSFPVCLVYFAKAVLRSVSKLDDVEGVVGAEDMG